MQGRRFKVGLIDGAHPVCTWTARARGKPPFTLLEDVAQAQVFDFQVVVDTVMRTFATEA